MRYAGSGEAFRLFAKNASRGSMLWHLILRANDVFADFRRLLALHALCAVHRFSVRKGSASAAGAKG